MVSLEGGDVSHVYIPAVVCMPVSNGAHAMHHWTNHVSERSKVTMKTMLARIVYWFVGYVLWKIRTYDRIEWIVDDGAKWEVRWWVFHEAGSQEHENCTRTVLGISAWYWADEYKITRWTGRRLHFAYRHSFRSGRGVRSFFKHYAIAYRLGL